MPIDPARRYRVVTNNFLRTGGDGYTVLRDRAIAPYDSGPGLDETVASRIKVGQGSDRHRRGNAKTVASCGSYGCAAQGVGRGG